MTEVNNTTETLKYYDAIINVAYINLFTLSKETGIITIENYDENNLSHRCVLAIARSAWGQEVEIITSPINFLLLKIFGHDRRFRGKGIKRSKRKHGIDINDFIQHIEQANNDKDVFEKIYLTYFRKRKK